MRAEHIPQTSQQLREFKEAMPRLSRSILKHEVDGSIGFPCHCGQGIRSTQCNDCTGYRSSCTECFLTAHRQIPFHWARVWDDKKGFFVRRDISTLRPHGYAIHLGHHGDDCPNPASDMDLFFHVVDMNGIHNTKIRFCNCAGSQDRLEQLMEIQLFPATVKRPTMAFTFAVLHQFHLQHLESKISAYDFIGTLRRLTDNAFASQVSVGVNSLPQCIQLTRHSLGSLSSIPTSYARLAVSNCREASWASTRH